MENHNEESLSVEDKELIKQAVLQNAVNVSHLNLTDLTEELIDSINKINQS